MCREKILRDRLLLTIENIHTKTASALIYVGRQRGLEGGRSARKRNETNEEDEQIYILKFFCFSTCV